MVSVYLLLGSNLGNRQFLLKQAAGHISSEAGIIIKSSGVYETQSWGKTNEPDYLNQVLLVHTQLTARTLLHTLQQIELQLGRERHEKWGARTMDIDILFYDDQIINEPALIIPHPELHKRRFTLEPLAEVTPLMLHPVLKKTIIELKYELKDKLQVKKIYF